MHTLLDKTISTMYSWRSKDAHYALSLPIQIYLAIEQNFMKLLEYKMMRGNMQVNIRTQRHLRLDA